jgi:preprotein translocase subunit SecE
MPSATDQEKENTMATDIVAHGADDRGPDESPKQPVQRPGDTGGGGGFFHIYKSGQGYWTRMGTAMGAGLVAIFTTHFIYVDLRPRIPYLREHPSVAMGIALGFLALAAVLIFYFINKPNTADFLIATDSEMKKVNWTSRKDLIGSTRVVIIFMFLIAGLLFGIDIVFGYVFYWLGVLKNPPF